MTRYFYDCEFIEDGHTIDLISIGIVAEDGRDYYAQSVAFEPSSASQWVRENVFPHLKTCSTNWPISGFQHVSGQCRHSDCAWRWPSQIAREVLAFMDIEKYGKPELWGYYSAYDHVAFCQLFGTMMDLPSGFPMYTRDIKQWCDTLGNPRLPEQGKGEHHALADARHNKVMYEFLAHLERERVHS